MRIKNIIGLVLLMGFGSLLFFSFGQQVSGYMDFAQAAESQSNAHVVGKWVEDRRFSYDRETNIFSFYMEDEAGNVRRVLYPNPKPANFEDADQVVIEGHMQGEDFMAHHILVKCPSKYNDSRAFEAQQTSSN